MAEVHPPKIPMNSPWVRAGETFVRSDGKEFVWDGEMLRPARDLTRCVKKLQLFFDDIDLWMHGRLVLNLPFKFMVTRAYEDRERMSMMLVIQSPEFPEVPWDTEMELCQKHMEWKGPDDDLGIGPEAIKVIHVS